MMERDKIILKPKNPINLVSILLLGIMTITFLVFSIYTLFYGSTVKIFDKIVIESRIVQFFIMFLVAAMMGYFFIINNSYKITISNNIISASKKSPMQKSKIKIKIEEIIEFKILNPVTNSNPTIYQYIEFKMKTSNTKKIWIKPFTKKQVQRILTLIKERGGMINKPKST